KIDAPIGRDKRFQTKFAIDTRNGKESITYFHVEKRYKAPYTLVTCKLLTGRTHQIRVHMEYIKHPVIGDPLYGTGNCGLYDKGQLLHAYRLTLIHPRTKKEVSFEAPLPSYFQEVLDKLI
ncbi:MAG: RluA family pseudouridine synthase, partial [Bacilli bacterium]|nr:RluA family pseudouridine synthase [Bacilli bacterium]